MKLGCDWVHDVAVTMSLVHSAPVATQNPGTDTAQLYRE